MPKKEKNSNMLSTIIGAFITGICSILAAFIGLYGYNLFNQTVVPSVTNFSVDLAIQTLTENHLKYEIANDAKFDENNIIIEQSIEPGTYVSKGTILILKVNTEPPTCEEHIANELSSISPAHPHYKWYICKLCGETFTLEETSKLSECDLCSTPSPSPSSSQLENMEENSDKITPGSTTTGSNENNPINSGTISNSSSNVYQENPANGTENNDSTQISNSSPQEPSFSVNISYTTVPEYLKIRNENIRIIGTTSCKVTSVKLIVEPSVYENEYSMHSLDQKNWFFNADFDTDGTYTITAVAYLNGETAKSNSISITYPFN